MLASSSEATTQVLYLCLLEAGRVGPRHALDSSQIVEAGQVAGLTGDQVHISLNRLEKLGCLRVYTLQHGKIKHFTVSVDGVKPYAEADRRCAEALEAFLQAGSSDRLPRSYRFLDPYRGSSTPR